MDPNLYPKIQPYINDLARSDKGLLFVVFTALFAIVMILAYSKVAPRIVPGLRMILIAGYFGSLLFIFGGLLHL